jgi:hypothetical protein
MKREFPAYQVANNEEAWGETIVDFVVGNASRAVLQLPPIQLSPASLGAQ